MQQTSVAAIRASSGGALRPRVLTSPRPDGAESASNVACYHPIPAWRTPNGAISLAKEQRDSFRLRLPCGTCLGCRMAAARSWSLRCQLELQQHSQAAWTTLTYDEQHKPPTLDKRHLQLFFKRLRKQLGSNRNVRYFASGEYGEQTDRPHYHAILYGINEHDQNLIEDRWQMGHARTVAANWANIKYTAGYTAKKIGYKEKMIPDQIDLRTGEVYNWQPPFIQMSRRPGIGANAKKWPQSWRAYAIQDGYKIPVPRYLHESWKQQASREDLEQLLYEKQEQATKLNQATLLQLEQAEQHAITQQKLAASKRNY